jgi:hypothetical protein
MGVWIWIWLFGAVVLLILWEIDPGSAMRLILLGLAGLGGWLTLRSGQRLLRAREQPSLALSSDQLLVGQPFSLRVGPEAAGAAGAEAVTARLICREAVTPAGRGRRGGNVQDWVVQEVKEEVGPGGAPAELELDEPGGRPVEPARRPAADRAPGRLRAVSAGPDLPELRVLGGWPDAQSGLMRYEPGGTLPGLVRLDSLRTIRLRGVYVVARWRATYQGTVDVGAGRELCLRRGDLPPGPMVELPFEYELPGEPWSYDGRLVTIEWELEARLDVPMAADRRTAVAFILAPAPPDADGVSYPGPATVKREGPAPERP